MSHRSIVQQTATYQHVATRQTHVNDLNSLDDEQEDDLQLLRAQHAHQTGQSQNEQGGRRRRRERARGVMSWRSVVTVLSLGVIALTCFRTFDNEQEIIRHDRGSELFVKQTEAPQHDGQDGLTQWNERDWVWGSIQLGLDADDITIHRHTTAASLLSSVPPTRSPWKAWVEHGIETFGATVNDWLLGFDGDQDSLSATSLGDHRTYGSAGPGLSTWAESSVYVDRTRSLYPSRPSAFGPHILHEPLTSMLFPITTFARTDSYGCRSTSSPSNSTTSWLEGNLKPEHDLPKPPKQGWIALIQRGHCAFSAKVRFAQERGAVAVVFGDQSVEEGGISGVGGLLTPWSPDDTSDVRIPSSFVSRSSYLSLLDTWHSVQSDSASPTTPPSSTRSKPIGLVVTLSKDELFAWPLVDLLLLVLFLPSLLTLLTVFSQRLRSMRRRRLDRAPKEIVAKLPVFVWTTGATEETASNVDDGEGSHSKEANATMEAGSSATRTDDEESAVGALTTMTALTNHERTPLLRTSVSCSADATQVNNEQQDSLLARWLPARVARLLPTRFTNSNRLDKNKRRLTLAPTKHKRYSLSNECAICLSDFEQGDRVMELPCGHIFHEEEITPWLIETKRLCPVCRASITAEPVEDPSSPSASSSSTVSPPAPQPGQTLLVVSRAQATSGVVRTPRSLAAPSTNASQPANRADLSTSAPATVFESGRPQPQNSTRSSDSNQDQLH
ncbi:hypothetical protein OIO90_002909 [Microbotryomycetes sp. JL221]|nr:hypothetical protein OIO90_002909 [Microbotryomycetes sp. JL221]